MSAISVFTLGVILWVFGSNFWPLGGVFRAIEVDFEPLNVGPNSFTLAPLGVNFWPT